MHHLIVEATLNQLLYCAGMEEYKGKLNQAHGVVIKGEGNTYRGGEVWASLAIRIFDPYMQNVLNAIEGNDAITKILKLHKMMYGRRKGVHDCLCQKNWLKLEKGQYVCRYCFDDVSKALAYIGKEA